jgi:hypothetical protein
MLYLFKFRMVLFYAAFLNVLFLPSVAVAEYNANMDGELAHIMVYADGDYIYFRLKNQPTSHPRCKPDYFVVSEDVPEARLNRIYSRLLAAYAAKEVVNIGFDAKTECVHGYIKVHRVG